MKLLVINCFTTFLLFAGLVSAQDGRYAQPVFDHVLVTSGIPFSSATAEGASSPSTLYFDFYEPSGDTLAARPLVITVFGGAFVAGSRDYVDMKAYGERLAKYGYAVASIDYRLLPLTSISATSLIRTAYMASQDVSAAIRFFKAFASDYRIDTSNIFLLGNSAGTIAILHEVFMTEEERPNETFASPDLGSIHSSGYDEYAGFSPNVAGVLAQWGGVMDVHVIDSAEYVPLCLIHGTNDNVVPFDSGYCYSSLAALLMPYMYGSHSIANHLSTLGIHNYELHPFEGEGHCFYIWGLNILLDDKFDTCFNIIRNFLYQHIQFSETSCLPTVETSKLYVFPNPAEQQITLHAKNLSYCIPCTVEVLDVGGNLVWSQTAQFPMFLNISNFSSGIYFIYATQNNMRFHGKFVKK